MKTFVLDWIAPFGKIFINLLKMIAVPLIVVSIIVGIADLKDISNKDFVFFLRFIIHYLFSFAFFIATEQLCNSLVRFLFRIFFGFVTSGCFHPY